MTDLTEEIPVQYLPGSALPRYVERLDDVEWVTDRRREPSVWIRLAAMISIVLGTVIVLIGLILLSNDRPPADLFPTRIPTPAASPRAVPDSGVRPVPAPGVPVVLPR